MSFDTVLMVDWSARSAPSPVRPTKDAIFIAEITAGHATTTYCRTRDAAHRHLEARFDEALAQGSRVLAGFDFPFGYPAGFARAVTGRDDPFALWHWLTDAIMDDTRNANNRLAVAGQLNAMFLGDGPFWSRPAAQPSEHVPFRKPPHTGFPFAERRAVEQKARGASTCFQLFGNGAVASQSLVGLPRLQALRDRYGADLAVRPFETQEAPLILAEVYPSMLSPEIKRRQRPGETLDAAQVRVLAEAFAGLPPDRANALLVEGHPEEGWIAGLGHEADLIAALAG